MSTSTSAPRVVAVVVSPRDHAVAALTVQGRPLHEQARAVLGAAGILEVDNGDADAAGGQSQAELRRGAFLVVHDAQCPLTPAWFVRELVEATIASGVAHVGTRPVTDTLKLVVDGRVGSTVDRDSWVAITSPLVIPPALHGVVDEVADVPRLVTTLRRRHPVELVPAPAVSRRVDDASALRLLEALA